MAFTDASLEALANLRNIDNIQWYVVPLILGIYLLYNNEIIKENWEAIFMGIIWFCLAGVVLEIINGLVLTATQYSALWTTTSKSAFVIYVGWNIEILFLAAVMGLMNAMGLPENGKQKVMGIPVLLFYPLIWTSIAVFIEVMLNFAGILVWEYWFWSWPNIYFIFLWWLIPNILFVWAHYRFSLKTKKYIAIASVIYALSFHVIFAIILKWV
ncbi:MAG: hypothetical protein GF317_04360 [Candidatus Lokiarchaeota archaeon]|nr:hypothetical protein [Candidatus Lokiarchaeota archaeon]MBD3199122.1 hypothetical protein [Candidatus Lokiarchaeota archaeon]